jgi:DUF1680 family protein
VPKAIAAAREYELTGNIEYQRVAVNFWRNVARTRSFIIGGNSETEHFFECGHDHTHLTARTAEFCNTYNMLKLTRHLFAWEPSSERMDFYERALYNHVLASQNSETGMNAYFLSLEPGGRKRYGTPDQTFWCCTGTGMEMQSKVAASIYLSDTAALYVNLFGRRPVAGGIHVWARGAGRRPGGGGIAIQGSRICRQRQRSAWPAAG